MLGIHAVPLLCHAADAVLLSVSDCAKLITARTRAIVLVTPNNPVRIIDVLYFCLFLTSKFKTSAIFSSELLSLFAVLAEERGRSRC